MGKDKKKQINNRNEKKKPIKSEKVKKNQNHETSASNNVFFEDSGMKINF